MVEHRFGGGWTLIKLEVLRKYLEFYTTALKNKNFRLVYIDAFAGSGECTVRSGDDYLTVDGSAKIALQATNRFDELHFIEESKSRHDSLERLSGSHPDQNIKVYQEDANSVILNLCINTDWAATRAVMFIDPYGLSLAWSTLEEVAKTKAIDVWYLFPLSGIFRQAAHDMSKIDSGKERKLDEVLGADDWREKFYSDSPQQDLFGQEPQQVRTVNVNQIENYVEARLRALFPAVAKPLRLPQSGAPLYSLFFCVSNPSGPAIGLSMKVAEHILKAY